MNYHRQAALRGELGLVPGGVPELPFVDQFPAPTQPESDFGDVLPAANPR